MALNKRIRKRLIDLDLSVTKLAEMIGLTREHVSNVISGHIKSKRCRKLIADALGKTVDELWGEAPTEPC